MSVNFSAWTVQVGPPPTKIPYRAGISRQFMQGDSDVWYDDPFVDDAGNSYDSSAYTFKYTLNGPITTPVVLTAVANNRGWKTTLDTTTSTALKAGTYGWQAQIFASGTRKTPDEGELTVEIDLSVAGANYDPRTLAEIAYAQAKAAFSSFTQSGGRVRSYTIGQRSMTFDNLAEVKIQVDFWKAEVEKEKMVKNPKRRSLLLRLNSWR